MGKSFKRIQHRQRIAARLAEQEIELVVKTVEIKPKSDSKISPIKEYKPEVIPETSIPDEVDDEEEKMSSEDLAKSVLQTQAKKVAPKKK